MKRLIIGVGIFLSVSLVGATSTNAFQLRNKVDPNMCLGLAASNVTNGTAIITYHCDGTPNQDWSLSSVETGDRLTTGANPNKCLTYDSIYQGHVVIWDCDNDPLGGASLQDWTVDSAGVTARLPPPENRNIPCFYIGEVDSTFHQVMGVAGGPNYVKDGGWTMLWDKLPGAIHEDQLWCIN
jgi:hypothetical protein